MILTGIVATPIDKFTDLYNTAAEKLEKILVYTRNCDTTPVEGNASLGVLLAKPSGKKGMAGQRLIHVCCPFWKSFFDGLMQEGRKEKRFDEQHDSWQHCFLSHRRRESAMIVM